MPTIEEKRIMVHVQLQLGCLLINAWKADKDVILNVVHCILEVPYPPMLVLLDPGNGNWSLKINKVNQILH